MSAFLTVDFCITPVPGDPEHEDALHMTMRFDKFEPNPAKYLGKDLRDGNGILVPKTRFVIGIAAEASGYHRSASLTSPDYGTLRKFREVFAPHGGLYVYRVWEGEVGSEPARRADYNRTDLAVVLSQDTTWYAKAETLDGYPHDTAQGTLPLWVTCDEDPDPEYDSGGTYIYKPRLTSVDAFTRPTI